MPRLNRRRDSCPSEPEPVLHSGVLFKRGYGTTPIIGRKTWKPRHFELTQTTLRYYTFENGELRDEIDLRNCRADSLEIMPSDAPKTGRSKSSIWRLALNVPQGRRVLMAAPTEREMNAWIKHIGGVLRDLHTIKQSSTEAPLSASNLVNQVSHEQEEKEEDEDDITLLEQVTSRPPDSLDNLAAARSKYNTTADFHNFVAQPRRSMIFRRHSLEGKPIVPGVYRSSTGQIDDRELAKELEELRGDHVSFHSEGAGDDDMAEQEEDALLRELRAFSAVHSERNDVDPRKEEHEDGNQREVEEVRRLASPVKPIFHFKKESTPPPTPREKLDQSVRSTDDAKWFSSFSSKFHRSSKRSINQIVDYDRVVAPDSRLADERTLVHRDDEDDGVPAHLKEDPATSKPRRYSTGSMLLASERHTLNPERDSEADREEALIHELLTGLVYGQYDENSVSRRLDSNEVATDPRPSGSSDGSNTTHSSGPTTSSGSPDAGGRLPFEYVDEIGLMSASPPRLETTAQRASEAFPTSPNSTTARVQPQVAAASTDTRADRDPRKEKRGLFQRWSDKLGSNRGTRSRRHSIGDTILDPGTPVSVREVERDEPGTMETKPVVDAQLEEARHFGVKLRRNTVDVHGLIELHEIGGNVDVSQVVEATKATGGDESEEEIVVVVVRRRHSVDKAVSMASQKRVKFRVFVDVGDDEAEGNLEAPHSSDVFSTKATATTNRSELVPRILPVMQQSPPVCAV